MGNEKRGRERVSAGNTMKGDRKQGGRVRERKREKLKDKDVENHLGMGECLWYGRRLERKSL